MKCCWAQWIPIYVRAIPLERSSKDAIAREVAVQIEISPGDGGHCAIMSVHQETGLSTKSIRCKQSF